WNGSQISFSFSTPGNALTVVPSLTERFQPIGERASPLAKRSRLQLANPEIFPHGSLCRLVV
ncbi:MAG: hypothetical protein ACXWWE_08645, partial [Nitrospira sp.]